jgi:hypothetical protein
MKKRKSETIEETILKYLKDPKYLVPVSKRISEEERKKHLEKFKKLEKPILKELRKDRV